MARESAIILRLSKEKRDEFKERCRQRGMTMTGRLMMMIVQDEWECEQHPQPREYSDRWKEICLHGREVTERVRREREGEVD